MDDLSAIGKTAASAMRAQSHRLRITAENLANAQSTGDGPGADPYRRKVISFDAMLDGSSGARLVDVASVSEDPSPFRLKYDPAHPAAGPHGMVKMPNVDPMIEVANSREAQRSYEANLNMMLAGSEMRGQLIGMLSK